VIDRSSLMACSRRCALALAGNFAVAMLLGSACFRISPMPPRELYRVSLPDTGAGSGGATNLSRISGTLAIAEYATPGIYGEPGIVFRIGESEYGSYPNREWALPLGNQLGVLTERVLARAPLTTEPAVFDPPSRRAQTYIWRGSVREFDEVDRDKQVFAAVRIDARLVRAADDSIIWSGTARAEKPVPSADMPGIVQALSALADQVVSELVDRARADLAAARVGNARPAP
jgi:ABC-type uncharacterized transport system auxiliary subunit